MQIDKSSFEGVQDAFRTLFVRLSASQPTELEMRYAPKDEGSQISRQMFVDVLRYFRTMNARKELEESSSVDVMIDIQPSSFRITFDSQEHFDEWIGRGKEKAPPAPAPPKVTRVTRIGTPIDISEYNLRVKLKEEEENLEDPVREAVLNALSSPTSNSNINQTSTSSKMIRMKHRFSSVSSKDPDFRYDLTSVRSFVMKDREHMYFVKEEYEAEIEFIRTSFDTITNTGTDQRKQLALRLFKAANILLKVIQNSDHVISNSVKKGVIEEYSKLTGSHRAIGMKPVTLMRQNLAPPGTIPGAISVTGGGYTVTEKADGERRMLFIASDRRVYLISERMTVTYTGVLLKSDIGVRSLLDGEFLPALPATHGIGMSEGRPPLFMCFDAFFVGGMDVRELPLWAPERTGMTDVSSLQLSTASSKPPKAAKAKSGKNKKTEMEDLLPVDRLGACERIILHDGLAPENSTSSAVVHCNVKTFYPVSSFPQLVEQASMIFDKRDAGFFPYDIDGLIFTPSELAMGATRDPDTGEVIPAPASGAGGWQAAMKWKPPEMNTIDFLVKFATDEWVVEDANLKSNNSSVADMRVRRAVDLYVGTSEDPQVPVNPLDFYLNLEADIRSRQQIERGGKRTYRAILFDPPGEGRRVHRAHLLTDEEGRVMVEGDEIRDGSIVEFSYDTSRHDAPPEQCWKPMRIRHDKTARLIQTKSLSGTLNDAHKTAYQVWQAIWQPVTEDTLRGREGTEYFSRTQQDQAPPGGLYYAQHQKDQRRWETASYAMNTFHNTWIKWRTLLQPFSGLERPEYAAHSLFDFGTGQGGDMRKWFDMRGLKRIVGIDLVEESLLRGGSGAYERLRQQYHQNPQKGDEMKVVFLPLDARKSIRSPENFLDALTTDDASFVKLARIAKGLEEVDETLDPKLKVLHGIAAMPCDLATAQFAVHYFCSDMDTLRSFAGNVASVLRPGGFFVGACLDGQKVDAKLRGLRRGDHIKGMGRDGGKAGRNRLMWHITKLYDGSLSQSQSKGAATHKAGPGEGSVGKRIRVYMETIGQAMDEYLVDFRLLEEVMRDAGLDPISKDAAGRMGFPDTEGDGFVAGGGTFEDAYVDMVQKAARGGQQGDDRRISAALGMTDVQKEYSFMNRWFVFQKRI